MVIQRFSCLQSAIVVNVNDVFSSEQHSGLSFALLVNVCVCV